MSFAPDLIVSGQFADVYIINGTSALTTGMTTQNVTGYARTNRTFAANTLFKVAQRANKILDAFQDSSTTVVKNNAVVVSPATYKILGGGYIYFPNAITPAGALSEAQVITVTGAPTSANLTFTFTNYLGPAPLTASSVAPFAWTSASTSAALQTHLQAITSIGSGNVLVTGSAGGPYLATFAGTLANMPQPLLTVAATFVAGTSPTCTISDTIGTGAAVGTSGITIDAYTIPSLAANQLHVTACKDWKVTKNSAIVQADTYGRGFGRDLPGIARGQFDFTQMSIDNTLHFYQVTNTPLTMAFYENVSAQAGVAPRIWVCQGYVTQTPVDAPLTGPVMGQTQGTLVDWPFFLNEAL